MKGSAEVVNRVQRQTGSTDTENMQEKRKQGKNWKVVFFLSHSHNAGAHTILSLTRGKRQTDGKERR